MSAALTPWFPCTAKPTRPGVYKTRMNFGVGYTFWNGRAWANQQTSIKDADQRRDRGMQNKAWRGLASDPSTPA